SYTSLLLSFSISLLDFYLLSFFFLMMRPPPISTLFPYTTLFRSPEGSLKGWLFRARATRLTERTQVPVNSEGLATATAPLFIALTVGAPVREGQFTRIVVVGL